MGMGLESAMKSSECSNQSILSSRLGAEDSLDCDVVMIVGEKGSPKFPRKHVKHNAVVSKFMTVAFPGSLRSPLLQKGIPVVSCSALNCLSWPRRE